MRSKSKFSGSDLTSGVTTNTAVYELINSSPRDAYVKRIRCTLNAATASMLAIGRPAAAGVTPTSPLALLDEAGIITSLVKTALAWGGAAPTKPTRFFRQTSRPATIGDSFEWSFETADDNAGLKLVPGATLVIWNIGGGSCSAVFVDAVVEQEVLTVANS
jgi:hypothetical protein